MNLFPAGMEQEDLSDKCTLPKPVCGTFIICVSRRQIACCFSLPVTYGKYINFLIQLHLEQNDGK